MKLTKIVATIGPSSRDIDVLRKMIRAGLNVARLNFSHGSYEDHADLIKNIRAAAAQESCHIGLLQDLQGPRLRIGSLPDTGYILTEGEQWLLTNKSIDHEKNLQLNKIKYIPIKFPSLHKIIKPSHRILIADGKFELQVEKIKDDEILVTVIRGGTLKSNKGLNFPDTRLDIPVITPKDKVDLVFGCMQGVHYIALSFVKSASDVHQLRKLIAKAQPDEKKQPKIIVKIERQEALENLHELIQATDAVMVARGDLGIEIPAAQVPIEQKKIISLSIDYGKTVITATQMLETMVKERLATRAEISDVANAIWDLTDATMLSGETAHGAWPVESVATMAEVAQRCEEYAQTIDYNNRIHHSAPMSSVFVGALAMAGDAPTRFILLTDNDENVRQFSSFRSSHNIAVVSSNPMMAGWVALMRGVTTVMIVSSRDLARYMQTGTLPLHRIPGVQDIIVVGTTKDSYHLILHR